MSIDFDIARARAEYDRLRTETEVKNNLFSLQVAAYIKRVEDFGRLFKAQTEYHNNALIWPTT